MARGESVLSSRSAGSFPRKNSGVAKVFGLENSEYCDNIGLSGPAAADKWTAHAGTKRKTMTAVSEIAGNN